MTAAVCLECDFTSFYIEPYIDAAEYEIMRMIADKDDPQADKEPLSLALYFEFCEETGTEPDPELLENHPYVQAHPEKYQHLSEE